MNIDTWKANAKAQKGVLVVWVDQSTDSALKAINSNGVCFAMARDFTLSFQAGGTAPFYFINGIRDADVASGGTNRIPAKYIADQQLYKAENASYNNTVKVLRAESKTATKEGKAAILKQLKDILQAWRGIWYGKTMKSFDEATEDIIISAFDDFLYPKMDTLVQQNGPSYFIVSMSKKGGGHAIAFGLRPDLSTDTFSGIYEYFDANLGSFTFPTFQNLKDFFDTNVLSLYIDYSKFTMASFVATNNDRHIP
ncbi:hypothetical protein F0919_14370 [Taibaiella lutea]|uniref:Peptidase C58 YopT-type domain-containing protein n=1 Tax=Taibaiella lutea TaxID=2608001 RepID=A0A5M6CEW4_9BACT|nr:hypothetical protein [Taibaiella lutea]KAA5533714.1 hypothetical protein F0919_14370 [Taibaiella lutea]